MEIEKLIEKLTELQKTHPKINVNVFDWRKNLGDDIGDGSSEGVYGDFEISVFKLEGEEAEFYKEQHGEEFVAWVALSFDNEDYNDDGASIK